MKEIESNGLFGFLCLSQNLLILNHDNNNNKGQKEAFFMHAYPFFLPISLMQILRKNSQSKKIHSQ
jgi:hypothetical protein